MCLYLLRSKKLMIQHNFLYLFRYFSVQFINICTYTSNFERVVSSFIVTGKIFILFEGLGLKHPIQVYSNYFGLHYYGLP